MLGLLDDWGRSADTAPRVEKLRWLKKGLAGIALVASCVCRATVRTCPLHEPICKESLAVRAVELLGLLLCYVSGIVHGLEYVLYDLSLLWSRSPSKIVERYIEPFVYLFMDCVVMVAKLPWRHSFLGGPCLGRRAVFVRTAHIQGLIASKSAKTCKDIRRENLREVSKMRDIVHIRQCACYESFLLCHNAVMI